MATHVIAEAAAPPATREHIRALGLATMWQAIRGNRKALAGLALFVLFAFLAAFPGLVAHDPPSAEIYQPSVAPSLDHLLGTTSYGQDIFAQLVYGTRESLIIALVVGIAATLISVVIGVSAAYLGGKADGALSLFTDVFLVIPQFPLAVVIAAYARSGGILMLLVVLIVTSWSFGARQLRAQAQSLRNRDFLEAARVRGETRRYIILFEMLPTMTSLIVANFLGTALYAVLTAAGLQFVGLGDVNSLSWGTMLYWAQNNEALQAGIPLWALAPGICIALLGAAFALLNYAFDEISNPALRPARRLRGRVAG
ncbi:MAG TPA: ABC transporter permease [Candidatus Dormibacteraeota bacterium]|nr:ABC transporter permease [Candidatus Dormibacteraeota bacterium]